MSFIGTNVEELSTKLDMDVKLLSVVLSGIEDDCRDAEEPWAAGAFMARMSQVYLSCLNRILMDLAEIGEGLLSEIKGGMPESRTA